MTILKKFADNISSTVATVGLALTMLACGGGDPINPEPGTGPGTGTKGSRINHDLTSIGFTGQDRVPNAYPAPLPATMTNVTAYYQPTPGSKDIGYSGEVTSNGTSKFIIVPVSGQSPSFEKDGDDNSTQYSLKNIKEIYFVNGVDTVAFAVKDNSRLRGFPSKESTQEVFKPALTGSYIPLKTIALNK